MNGSQVCRMHGAHGGAPLDNRNALKHGLYSDDAMAFKREIQSLSRASTRLIKELPR